MSEPSQGEVWWGEAPDEKGRPFLIVSRDAANEVMQRVLVAPVTTRIRGLPSELCLGRDEGLPAESVASFDNVPPFHRPCSSAGSAHWGPGLDEICRAAEAALDC